MYNWDKYFKKKLAQESTRNAAAEFAEGATLPLSTNSRKLRTNLVSNSNSPTEQEEVHFSVHRKNKVFSGGINSGEILPSDAQNNRSAFSVVNSDELTSELNQPLQRINSDFQNSQDSSDLPHPINNILNSPVRMVESVLNSDTADLESGKHEIEMNTSPEKKTLDIKPKQIPLISISNPDTEMTLDESGGHVQVNNETCLKSIQINEESAQEAMCNTEIGTGCPKCFELQKVCSIFIFRNVALKLFLQTFCSLW